MERGRDLLATPPPLVRATGHGEPRLGVWYQRGSRGAAALHARQPGGWRSAVRKAERAMARQLELGLRHLAGGPRLHSQLYLCTPCVPLVYPSCTPRAPLPRRWAWPPFSAHCALLPPRSSSARRRSSSPPNSRLSCGRWPRPASPQRPRLRSSSRRRAACFFIASSTRAGTGTRRPTSCGRLPLPTCASVPRCAGCTPTSSASTSAAAFPARALRRRTNTSCGRTSS
mmetsp:Transcript_11181/g.35338  ORF Transcript_11181/g.35338 Transcript_11181/m.35338 type:complete len:228 (+) Transcript_11181:2378-3061(+)